MKANCLVDHCDATAYGRGLCNKHYQCVYKRGTLELTRNWGSGNNHAERFWSRVDKTSSPRGCWLWTAGKTGNGYALITVNYRRWYIHRYAWFLIRGVEPTLDLLHSCDTPLCVNPDHLREGTQADNSQDMIERGRSLIGSKQPNSKLTEQDVIEIRNGVASGKSQAEYVRKYQLSTATVFNIVHRKMWRHI